MQEAWKANEVALREMSKIHELKELPQELERMAAERTRELLEATAEPVTPSKYQEPVMYYEPAEGTGGLPAVMCTCGWSKRHLRFKVLQVASRRHWAKTGHKQASKGDGTW